MYRPLTPPSFRSVALNMHSYLLSSILMLSVTCSWYSLGGFRRGDAFSPKGKPKHNIPRYMWDIYADWVNSSEVDVVKGLFPKNRGVSFKSRSYQNHRKKEFEFRIPELNQHEKIVKAEVRINGIKNAGVQIYTKNLKWVFLDEKTTSNGWMALDVTSLIKNSEGRSIRFLIVILFREKNRRDVEILQPVLLLYGKEISRRKRSLEDFEEETNRIWQDEGFRSKKFSKRLKGGCRRKPLYIKFSDIDYDSWIVAPEGYEAFQCVGKCSFPVSENLTPTKHAILQTLLHNKSPSKVPTACCVPTKLEPISVLYVDVNGVLTYRFRYHDMVVAECGCR